MRLKQGKSMTIWICGGKKQLTIPIAEGESGRFALEGWDGHRYTDCWKIGSCSQAGKRYCATPVGQNEFELETL